MTSGYFRVNVPRPVEKRLRAVIKKTGHSNPSKAANEAILEWVRRHEEQPGSSQALSFDETVRIVAAVTEQVLRGRQAPGAPRKP